MIFKNKEAHPLTLKEKKQREILRFLLIVIFSVVIKGMYNTNKGLNQDEILVPAFCTAAETFFIIYILNAFGKGNLVRRWANEAILISLFNFIQTKRKISDEKTMELAIKIFGLFGITVFIATIILELNYYFFSK